MSSSRSAPCEAEWLKYKSLIRSLYLVEEISLIGLVEELKSFGFLVTTSQLEFKLKKWKFKKNVDKKTWAYIDYHITKRKKEDKDSEVIYCGKRMKMETVKKETNRNRDMSIFSQLARR
ncbi:hypothetical protein ONZ43_g5021 [Nemania bipapillata]|uniref:Uncharacterized protein n=1 Tax=Nemania bipapillata TaxID=110536 RepID=A0ACC2IFL1_9PEZI|nr:hypothetical protein ONZ43_g5021 [Nemania bipapillata]